MCAGEGRTPSRRQAARAVDFETVKIVLLGLVPRTHASACSVDGDVAVRVASVTPLLGALSRCPMGPRDKPEDDTGGVLRGGSSGVRSRRAPASEKIPSNLSPRWTPRRYSAHSPACPGPRACHSTLPCGGGSGIVGAIEARAMGSKDRPCARHFEWAGERRRQDPGRQG